MIGISYGYGRGTNYYNVIDQLNDQGYIASRAFSLDLGNVDTSEGMVAKTPFDFLSADYNRVNYFRGYRH